MAKKRSKRAPQRSAMSAGTDRSPDRVVNQVEEAFSLGSYEKCHSLISQYLSGESARLNALPIETVKMACWSAYFTGNTTAAGDWVSRLSTTGLNNDDRLLRSLIEFEFRNFMGCVEHGEPLLQGKTLARTCADHREGKSLEIRFLNALGMSQHNLDRNREAVAILARAIEADNDYPESYINLATVFGHLGDVDSKRRVISDGLVRCTEKSDLQKLAVEFLGDETISLCMIVKNEEKLLAQCLDSVCDVVDEIIVVDTGSEDRTVEIAKRYGARVYHHAWEDDFSLARNQSLGYATCDWILILDADEVLVKEDHSKLRMATRIPDMNVVSLSVFNQHQRTGDMTSFLPSVRLWRRKLNAQYEGIVHNELRISSAEPVLRADIRLIHYGYGLDWEMMKKKIARSKALLQKQLEENPANAFANFNYSQILRGEHKTPPPEVCREILDHSGRAVTHTDPSKTGQRHIHLMALDQIASAHFYLREYDLAEQAARNALEVEPSYLDAKYALGNIFAGKRDFEQAIRAYQEYIVAADAYNPGSETQNLILIHAADQAAAYFSLGLIHEEKNQPQEAITYFLRIFDYKPDHGDVNTHLAMLYYRGGDLETARRYANARLETVPQDATARSILADIARRHGRLGDARSECQRILDTDASNRQALELLVRIEKEAGDLEAGIVWNDRILESSPDDYRALCDNAELLMGLMRYADAAVAYEMIQCKRQDDAEIANNIGNCHFKMNDYENAVRYYSQALSIEPQMTIALRNLGYTYFKLGDNANAVRKLTNYLDYVPEDFDILYLVSRLYFQLTQYADALRYVERCVVLQPQSAELISFLADCYLKLGHEESARLGYQRALSLDPGFEPARIMLNELKELAATSAALTRLAKQGAKA